MRILLGFLLLFSMAIHAEGVRVKLSTKSPVVGEEFQMSVIIETQSDEEPDISFTPYNVEVMGKSNEGLSIRTTVVNGRISTKRSMTYVYRLIAPKSGTFRINEIVVEIGGKRYRHPNLVGTALKEAAKPKAIFAYAIPSKTEVYKGEGITVDYYLYFKVPVRGLEIEKFPKLNSFIKRFKNPNENVEQVEYRGELYRRVKKYSARIYPQKIGKLYIDPIVLRVAYDASRSGYNPFGLSRVRQKSVSSKKIEITVLPLPAENVPKNFTGLVGKHKVKFTISANKFLVNEAIEARIVVEGGGELENLPPFKIYENPYLESFDIKENLEELDRGQARKTFDYTFLGRRKVSIPAYDYKYSYFDPEKKEYVEEVLKLPALTIEGASVTPNYGGDVEESHDRDRSVVMQNEAVASGFVAPFFIDDGKRVSTKLFSKIKYLLIILILVIWGLIFKRFLSSGVLDRDDEFTSAYKTFFRVKDYASLYAWLSFFLSSEGESIAHALQRLKVDPTLQEYFLDLLKSFELQKFAKQEGRSSTRKVKINKKYFKQLYSLYYAKK